MARFVHPFRAQALRIRAFARRMQSMTTGALFRVVMVTAVAFSAACASRMVSPANVRTGWSQSGVASWYGEPFHGRRTASGETYDMRELTAAHPSLPFGTRVRVRNLDNGRDVEVRINDRGPFVKQRIIDVSRRAAETLGMIGPGTARVRITVIQEPPGAAPPRGA
jgi:rare lipoprotein A (peptidoglycan hydrolase)